MRKRDKLKNIEEANKRLMTEWITSLESTLFNTKNILRSAQYLEEKMKHEGDVEGWVVDYLSRANVLLEQVHQYYMNRDSVIIPTDDNEKTTD